jgi:hypothetical protein
MIGGSGHSSGKSFAMWEQATSSWRTPQASLLTDFLSSSVIWPSAGVLLSTLRSRLLPLPLQGKKETASSELIETFLQGKKDAREKVVAKLLERAKSDKDQEKQAARLEALTLAEALALQAYAQAEDENGLGEYHAFLQDLHTFIPILSERSAPLKPIFEHILLTIPAGLGRT